MTATRRCVVKVGGSLFDWPPLGGRLRRWLADLAATHLLLVPGGGPWADLVRTCQPIHALDDPAAHEMALRSMHLTARLLRALAPEAIPLETHDALANFRRCRSASQVAILDRAELLWQSTAAPDLPHPPCNWSVTSDSIAAWLAAWLGADELVLLKSASVPGGISTAEEAAAAGLVDDYFPRLAGQVKCWRIVNLRAGASRPCRGYREHRRGDEWR